MDDSVEPTQALRGSTSEWEADAADALVVGAPEPADWVRLPVDPRAAPTLPSVRRRNLTPRAPAKSQAPPAVSLVERRRERFQRWIAFGLGSLLAVLAVGFGVVSSEEVSDVPAPGVAAAIEPARTASPEPPRVEEAAEIPPPPELLGDSAALSNESPATAPPRAAATDSAGNGPALRAGSGRADRSENPEVGASLANPGARAGQRNKPKNKLWFPPE